MGAWAGGTARGGPPLIDMRTAVLIACALALAACGREPPPLAVGARDAAGSEVSPRAGAPVPVKAPEAATARAAMPAPEALTDAAITEKIRSAIAGDPGMAGSDVSINIDRGVVVLAGTVKTHEQTGIASSHAQGQDGVVRVDNQLRPALS